MLWLGRHPAERRYSGESNRRRFYRQSIELPIAIAVAGLPAPVYGTLVDISETGCRLRSLILIDRDRDVEFELQRPNQAAFLLMGRIVTRAIPQKRGGYEYGVSFARMATTERAALSREIREIERREARSRADRRSHITLRAIAKSASQRRGSVRTMAAFPVRYRADTKPPVAALANDISAGGLRLLTQELLVVGAVVRMCFTLPNDFLFVYPPAAERVEMSPFGPRRLRIPDNRRPFEEMTVHGRIVSRFQPRNGREVFGVEFTDVDGYQSEEIARFTHAVQLAKLRTE